MVSVAAIQLCPYSMKAALEYVNDGCSSGPIKLYLPKQTAGRVWSMGYFKQPLNIFYL